MTVLAVSRQSSTSQKRDESKLRLKENKVVHTDFARVWVLVEQRPVGSITKTSSPTEEIPRLRFRRIVLHREVLTHRFRDGIAIFAGLDALFRDHLDLSTPTTWVLVSFNEPIKTTE